MDPVSTSEAGSTLYRVERPEIVTDPDVAETQIVWGVLRWEDLPTERRAFGVYAWCRRLVELGEGDRLAGFPRRFVANVEADSPCLRSDEATIR